MLSNFKLATKFTLLLSLVFLGGILISGVALSKALEHRKHKEYTNFLYKDATLNPTNLRDKADEFETNLVVRFRNSSGVETFSVFRTLFGEKLFYSARPLTITKQSCLRCHSTPESAPKSLLATYGTLNGFGWKLNDIVATQII